MQNVFRHVNKKAALFLLAGVFIGIALLAGTSSAMTYTDSADFCSSCHVMDEAYDSFKSSNHASLSCNDCHAPTENLASKLAFKAKAGGSHMYMNTIGRNDIPDVLYAKDASVEVIEANCISCHEAGLSNVEYHDVKEGGCIDCHRDVPHGNGMYKPDDWFEPGNYEARS